jgi:hypothetical protein
VAGRGEHDIRAWIEVGEQDRAGQVRIVGGMTRWPINRTIWITTTVAVVTAPPCR